MFFEVFHCWSSFQLAHVHDPQVVSEIVIKIKFDTSSFPKRPVILTLTVIAFNRLSLYVSVTVGITKKTKGKSKWGRNNYLVGVEQMNL